MTSQPQMNGGVIFDVVVMAVGAVATAGLAFVTGKKSKLSLVNTLTIWWLMWDIIVHVVVEAPFLIISMVSTANKSTSFFALPWKEYGKADTRWLDSNPYIVCLECVAVFPVTIWCVMLIYAIVRRRPYRHWLQLVLSTCELYGNWMQFGPEWIAGNPDLSASDPVFLWVYLVFFNAIWLVFPILLVIHSWYDMVKTAQKFPPTARETAAARGVDTAVKPALGHHQQCQFGLPAGTPSIGGNVPGMLSATNYGVRLWMNGPSTTQFNSTGFVMRPNSHPVYTSPGRHFRA
jgi:hypothetical protein